MSLIVVRNLEKQYPIYRKKSGSRGFWQNLLLRDKQYVRALDGIDLQIKKGELVGVLGPNGAGKTTLLKILSGILYPSSGEVRVLDFVPWERKLDYQRQFALVMGQKGQLIWDLPARETFLLNQAIYQIPDHVYETTLEQLTDLLSLDQNLMTQPVRQLSLGERMKCELVAALIHKPAILYLDEPTIGLDVSSQKKVRDFIKKINREFSTTILLTSHYMEDIKDLCQKVVIINQGRIFFEGELSEIIQKYAPHKIIKASTRKKIDSQQLMSYGQVLSSDQNVFTVQVARHKCAEVASRIIKDLQTDDLLIEEEKIENIMRDVFAFGTTSNSGGRDG